MRRRNLRESILLVKLTSPYLIWQSCIGTPSSQPAAATLIADRERAKGTRARAYRSRKTLFVIQSLKESGIRGVLTALLDNEKCKQVTRGCWGVRTTLWKLR
jgi:hypothetical protein